MIEVSPIEASCEPKPLSELLEGFWITKLLGTAVSLGLPEVLSGGPKSFHEIARLSRSDPSCTLRVLKALQTIGVCRARSQEVFELTERGQILRDNVAGSISGRAAFTSGMMWDLFGQLTKVVRTGLALPAGRDGFNQLANHPGLAGMHRAMVESSTRMLEEALKVHDFGQYPRVLDVGGGYGGALAILLQNDARMTGGILDLEYLGVEARAFLSSRGVRDRAQFISGDFFEVIPQGYDCYLLKYIIHDWGDTDALRILHNCAIAAAPRSHVVLLERVMPDVLEVTPQHQAIMQIDLAMMVTGGKERTEAEYRSLLSSAGLEMTAVIDTTTPCSIILSVPKSDI